MHVRRLELYVDGRAPRCATLILAIREALRKRPEAAPELAVFDVRHSPLAAEQADVWITPTLVARDDQEERRIFGDVGQPDALLALLDARVVPA
jgi:hypothetical protein